ncbi:hypothetical protein [Nocardia gipuzkoensis]
MDNSYELRRVPDVEYNRNRTIHMCFTKVAGGFTVQAWGSAFPPSGGGSYRGFLRDENHEVDLAISGLRAVWQRKIVDYSEGFNIYPFSDKWDLSGPLDRERLNQVGLTLAREGSNLFDLIFDPKDEGLREIREHLVCALRAGEQVITMESDELFAPWGMLYVPPEGTDLWLPDAEWSMDGFIGYRHLIEHNFSRVPWFDSRISIDTDRVVVGLNIDERVDNNRSKTPFVGPVVTFFSDRTSVVVRRSKPELAAALRNSDFGDHITYFGCHGRPAGKRLELSTLVLEDDEVIASTDFRGWLSGRTLPTKPMVFVSACEGGQMATLFYRSFGLHLLQSGARCLVGPQVDMPVSFAREYTERLFSQFLQPDRRLGDIVRDLTREFADTFRNPLGLIFSLYRGIDVHLSPTSPQ